VRLSHSRLEAARQDPMSFGAGTGSPSGFRFSKVRALHYAVYEFHRTDGDLSRASDYLYTLYHRNFKTTGDYARLDDQLAEYAAWYRLSGFIVVEYRLQAAIPLGSGVQLVGEIPRLDLDPTGGYAVWLFGKKPNEWRGELRMPLLQAGFAQRMGVRLDQVAVGFYFFETGDHERECYDSSAVAAAQEEAATVASALAAPPAAS
jgi:hypothetical protein